MLVDLTLVTSFHMPDFTRVQLDWCLEIIRQSVHLAPPIFASEASLASAGVAGAKASFINVRIFHKYCCYLVPFTIREFL